MANDDITGLSEEDLVQEKNNLHEQLEQVRAQLKNNPSGPMLNTKQSDILARLQKIDEIVQHRYNAVAAASGLR
jgi:hypothetical protein